MKEICKYAFKENALILSYKIENKMKIEQRNNINI